MKFWYLKLKNKYYDIQEAECSGRPTDVDEASLREPVGKLWKNLTNRKIIFCMWWDSCGIIHKEYLKKK